jgi:TRAP transporter 4TM/12TM fusion protein
MKLIRESGVFQKQFLRRLTMFSMAIFKKYENIKTYLIFLIALSAAFYHLYTGGFGYSSVRDLRIIHWLAMSTLVFLLYPTFKSKPDSKISKTIDMLFFSFAFLCGIYILFNWRTIVIDRGELVTNIDVFFGILATIVVLEAIRRVIGWFLLSVTLISVIYFFAGSLITSNLGHRAFSLSYVSSLLYISTSGIYGLPLGVSAKYIVLFIIFAAILRGVRGDILFNDLANSLVGHLVGGTAKVAVVSSAFFGAVSGSAAANVATTGSFTIPAMKKAGYSPRMAGAIESVASTAGQITPPILGVAAFLIADLIGIDYIVICAASLIPAILYYLTTYIVIHNYSINLGILGIVEKSKRPELLKVLADRGHLIGSFGVFIYLIVRGYSPMFSIFWGLVSLFCISMLKANTRMNIKQILFSLTEGVKDTIPIATACAAAGIISCSLLATGLGLSFSSVVLSYTQNSLILTLLFTMVATLILGCGMPTTPAYIIVSVITVQTLLGFSGIAALQAHFYIFYFAVLSTITLPVALSCYVASGIAKESPIKIGISAMILAAGVFFLPYLFIYKRGLLLLGSVHEIFLDIITSTTVMICIAFFSSQLLSRKAKEQEIELSRRIIQAILIFSIIIIVLILPSFVPYTSILSTILNFAAFIASIWFSFIFFRKKKAEIIQ